MHIEVRDHAAITNCSFTKSRASATPCFSFISRDRELHLAGKLRVLALLARLHLVPQVSRSFKRSGAPSGNITSEWTTPALFEKSWSRPSRSSCSSDAER
jgi:hypothetical protein